MRFHLHPGTRFVTFGLMAFALSLGAKAYEDEYAYRPGFSFMLGGKVVEVDPKTLEEPAPSRFAQGSMILVDTRDPEACERIRHSLEQNPRLFPAQQSDDQMLANLCAPNPGAPVTAILLMREEELVTPPKPLSNDPLTKETRALALGMVGAMGILWMAPESITQWDKTRIKNEIHEPYKAYWRNIKGGPVWDNDEDWINYIGHPISGAAYYVVARNLGYSKMQSFTYSALMSTFFWEYGFEALAEKPSIQDLLLTPTAGALIGEAFYQMLLSIEANGGTVLGSKTAGKVATILLNPAGSLSGAINKALDTKMIRTATTQWVVSRVPVVNEQPHLGTSAYVGVRLNMTF